MEKSPSTDVDGLDCGHSIILDEEPVTPEDVIDGFMMWLHRLPTTSRACAAEIVQAETLACSIWALYGKSQATADMLRALKQVLIQRMREVTIRCD